MSGKSIALFSQLSLLVIVLLLAVGCSGSGAIAPPTVPAIDESSPQAEEAIAGTAAGYNRFLWSYHLIWVDPSTKEFEVIPVREALTHMNIIQFLEKWPCTNCLKLEDVTFNPDGTLEINVTVKNPFKNTNLTGFDVRGIAMFNGSHQFPESGLVMSDRTLGEGELVNADGYTTLYNPTTIGHGLKGYFDGRLATATFPNATLNGYRLMIPKYGNGRNYMLPRYNSTESYRIHMPDSLDPWIFGYAVDACWAPPINKPVTNLMEDFGPEANCAEAWKIEVQDLGPGLVADGGTTTLQIDVYDWQGKDDAHPVLVECPDLFDGVIEATWKSDEDEYTRYEVAIENAKPMPTGRYPCLISKEAQENDPVGKPWLDLTAYQVFPVEVGWALGYPISVTSPWLSLRADEVAADDNYIYVGSYYRGLHIFDISDPLNLTLVKQVPVSGSIHSVAVSGGYAFVAGNDMGLQIIDVDPPESAYVVNAVDGACGVCYVPESGEYAYTVEGGTLTIIDIAPPESAHIINSVYDFSQVTEGFAVSGGYAYVPLNDHIPPESFFLNIIDIDPPESAHVANKYNTGCCWYVATYGNYAYLDYRMGSLAILDITDPESPVRVTGVGIDGQVGAFSESGEYAYVADWSTGLHIVNIDPPESAYVVKTVELPVDEDIESDVDVSNGYAYYADNAAGLYVIDIDPPESAEVINSVGSPVGTYEVDVSGNYAYIAGRGSGLQIIDISNPESARIVKSLPIGQAYGIAVLEGYAYVADHDSGLQIVDVDPQESAYIVNAVDTPGSPEGVDVAEGCAFIADGESGLQLIDIDPPESAYIYNTVNTPLAASDVALSAGYAYVTDDNLEIIDIDPPGSTHIVNSIEIGDAWEVAISGGYAYVGGSSHAVRIIDIDPPESAYIVNAVETSLNPSDIAVSGNYAYVAVDSDGVLIYDINPPESACLLKSFKIPNLSYDAARGVAVAGNYLYVTSPQSGLWIFKLW